MKNTEILIPTWPDHSTTQGKLGIEDYGNWGFRHDSVELVLRARPKGDGYEGSYLYQRWSDIALRIWCSPDSGISIEFKCKSASCGQRDLELLLAAVKWVNKKLDTLPSERTTSAELPYTLLDLFASMGIKRTLQYHGNGQPATYAPISTAVQLIVAEVQRRLDRIPERQAA